MKVALCFIISYQHILNKEQIWREWVEQNKDIINMYFYYKDFRKIQSSWIRQHTIPPNYIVNTSYYHVVPAYLSVLKFAYNHDPENKWFCMLTDSCCPIISPAKFKDLFFSHSESSILSWKPAWWNPHFHKRGNLAKLARELWLGNDPWFVLTRDNVAQIFHFVARQPSMTKTICSGGLANESLFAIIFQIYRQLDKRIICSASHLADWSRMSSATSPHVFREGNNMDIAFLDKELKKNKYAIFVRKVAPDFPDKILRNYLKLN